MAENKKVTIVRTHLRHVPPSKKNPQGLTVVDHHLRRLPGTYLDPEEIEKTFKSYDGNKIIYPAKGRLSEYESADDYDDLIAVWTDYFNKKFSSESSLDPNLVKALIGSESGFEPNPPKNKTAFGIAQITKSTSKSMQDPNGESKDFLFGKILQKDLKKPEIAIPMAIRWLFRKKRLAFGKLGKEPTADEIILEYKGMLKSKTGLKDKALKSFRDKYEKLKK